MIQNQQATWSASFNGSSQSFVPFWLQWVAYKPVNKLWVNEFVSKRADDFLEKINSIRFFPNLSFIIVSVLIYLLIDFGLFYLLVSTWVDIFPNIIVWTKHG